MIPAQTPYKVAILGAGALGAAYASRFYAYDPRCVALIAEGERRERLLAEGLIINGTRYAVPVIRPQDRVSPVELVIVALKHQHLAGAIGDLHGCIGPQTVILSVMNGIDSEPVLAAEYGWDRVLYCIAVAIDAVRTGNNVVYSNLGRLVLGEADNSTLSERVKRTQALLALADIPTQTPPDMLRQMWWKLMVNVGVNQASAVLRAPYGVFQKERHAQAVMEAAMREVITLAQEVGVNLSPADVDGWYPVLNLLHPEGKTSMLQDVEAGRVTEVDIFAGKIVELGETLAIPTPVNRLLFHAIKAIEAQAGAV